MALSETEHSLPQAMQRIHAEGGSKKSDRILRNAIRAAGSWDDNMEDALRNAGDEHSVVAEYYNSLRRIVRDTPFANGAGNLDLPAGPRYTECWITAKGIAELVRHDDETE